MLFWEIILSWGVKNLKHHNQKAIYLEKTNDLNFLGNKPLTVSLLYRI